MPRFMLAFFLPAALGSLLWLPAHAQSRKLNGPLAPLPADEGAERIFESVLSPDGAWVVYRADHDLVGDYRLYSVPADASASAGPLSPGGVRGFLIDPTSARVAYQTTNGVLLLVPIDGSAIPLRIRASAQQYAFTPDGSALLFQDEGLYVVPVQGGEPLLLASGGDRFELAGDTARVVYRVRESLPFFVYLDELWSVVLDGSAAPVLLSAGLEGEIRDFRPSPDGARVLFRHVDETLYSVELVGPPNRRLQSNRANAYRFTSDGARVVFTEVTGAQARLVERTLPAGPSRVLVGPLPEYAAIVQWEISADDRWLVYRTDPRDGAVDLHELAAVPLSGGPGVTIDRVGVTSFRLTPDSRHVVFTAEDVPGGRDRLFSARLATTPRALSVPRTRTLAARPLDPSTFEGAEVTGFAPSRDSRAVVFVARQDAWNFELFVTDVEGRGAPLELSLPFPEGGDVRGQTTLFGVEAPTLLLAPERAVYRGDQVTNELVELFSVPLDGSLAPVRLNPELAPSPEVGYVSSFVLEPGGAHVLFVAHGQSHRVNELYRVPLAGGTPERSSPPLRPEVHVQREAPLLAPDGSRAVFQLEPRVTGSFHDLYVVDLDASGPARLLTGSVPDSFELFDLEFGSDSNALVFRAWNDVYATRLDGSSSSLLLGRAYPISFYDRSLRLTSDVQRVVFPGVGPTVYGRSLFSAPLDGSAAPVLVSGALTTRLDIAKQAEHELADGARAVFLASVGSPLIVELFSAPADASAVPVLLSGALVSGGSVEQFAVAGARAVYRADEEVNERFELYGVPTDASQPRVRLSGALAAGADVGDFLPTPDGSEVLYVAQEAAHASYGIYVVALDGSAPARRLAGAEPDAWVVSPDGSTVVYASAHRVPGIRELFSVPLDQSRGPLRLSASMPAGGDIAVFSAARAIQITPDSRTVVYLADQLVDERLELFAVDIDALSAPVLLNGPLAPDGDVVTVSIQETAFQLTPDGSEVLYLAREQSTRAELYAAPIP